MLFNATEIEGVWYVLYVEDETVIPQSYWDDIPF